LLENRGYLSKPRFEPLERIKHFDFRRLFYTAFSRAQNLLVLAAQERSGRGKSPSKYFERLFYELPSWRTVPLNALTFEAVKEINLKREYSFTSHITVFENCAEQYRFFKELEFAPIRESPMLFGTLVHQTIEDIHKTVLRGEEHTITPDAIRSWFSTNYAMLSKKERVYLAPSSQQAALQHVLRYYERENGNWDRIKEAEVEISLVKDQYILKGSVDLIRGEYDTVEIIDFKTEKKPDMEKDRERLRQYQHQLEVYAHLVEERTGQKVSRMHLYYTGEDGGNPYVSFTKDDRTIGKTIARFDDIVARIERQDYRMAARPAKLCQNCDMRAYCDNKNWTFTKARLRLKPHILSVASTATLRQIAADFELSVNDKRKRQLLVEAISSARRCQPTDLLGYLGEPEVKQICEAAGVDSKGRRNALITRLLDAASPAPKPVPAPAPRRQSNTRPRTFNHPPKSTTMSDQQPTQANLQLAGTEAETTNVEKYEFEPIKGTRCSTGGASARSPRRSITRRN
jgi:CRISPR/Cas system-associated exonuclease Cas4 (RecB family)